MTRAVLRPRYRSEPRAWTAEEDARLRDVSAAGLSSDFWKPLFSGRDFGEIVARRLDLKVEIAPLL